MEKRRPVVSLESGSLSISSSRDQTTDPRLDGWMRREEDDEYSRGRTEVEEMRREQQD